MESDRHMLAKHKKLAVVYVVLVLGLLMGSDPRISAAIGVSFAWVGQSLGPGYAQLMRGQAFLVVAVVVLNLFAWHGLLGSLRPPDSVEPDQGKPV